MLELLVWLLRAVVLVAAEDGCVSGNVHCGNNLGSRYVGWCTEGLDYTACILCGIMS